MKRRALCLWLPNWPIQRRLAGRRAREHSLPGCDSEGIVLYHSRANGGCRVSARSLWPARMGVVPGMTLAEAHALLGPKTAVRIEPDDPVADKGCLDRLASWCFRFSPVVALEVGDSPSSIFLDVAGCDHLWGGEERFARVLIEELACYGLQVRVAVADTWGASWAVAHYGRDERRKRREGRLNSEVFLVPSGQTADAIFPLPVEALRLSPPTVQTLRELGIAKIGSIESLSRASLVSRFDAELLLRLDQAMGRATELLPFQEPPAEVELSWPAEYPVIQTDFILKVLEGLMERLLGGLPAGYGVLRFEVQLRGEASKTKSRSGDAKGKVERGEDEGRCAPVCFPLGLCRPSARRDRLIALIRLALERTKLREPVLEIRLRLVACAPLEVFAGELFEDSGEGDPRELEHLLERLTSRLGRQRVLRAHIQKDAQPERMVGYRPAVDLSRRGVSLRREQPDGARRPLCLLVAPERLTVRSSHPAGEPVSIRRDDTEEAVVYAWGPERIETGWWRGEWIGRDYYRIETAQGQWLWIYRDMRNGEWFLQGMFA